MSGEEGNKAPFKREAGPLGPLAAAPASPPPAVEEERVRWWRTESRRALGTAQQEATRHSLPLLCPSHPNPPPPPCGRSAAWLLPAWLS